MSDPKSGLLLASLLILILGACTTPTLNPLPASTVTPLTSLVAIGEQLTCADLDSPWGTADWPRVLNILHRLQESQQSCGSESLKSKEYAAHFNYAAALETRGQRAEAIEQYRAALTINLHGREALTALVRLNALPTLPPPSCQPTEVSAYSPLSGDFVVTAERGFTLGGRPFYLHGLNYYPRHAPWEAFLTSADMTEVAHELDLIAKAGFNTLRIMVWYEPLFTCTPEDAVPNAEGFAKLDTLIALAHEHNLRLIVTLHDLPDLYFRPLYTDYARYDAQTAFIVKRYHAEPTILAWDLRNEPDLDYGADGRPAVASSEDVLKWLAHSATLIRQTDQQHLITIGWWGDPTSADEFVDFLSFHHWAAASTLAQRIRSAQAASAKPLVLEEVGYPAWDQNSETQQAKSLQETIGVAENNGVTGWLIWAAFDFTPPAGQASNPEYFFGLWRTDLTPKPALTVLPLQHQP